MPPLVAAVVFHQSKGGRDADITKAGSHRTAVSPPPKPKFQSITVLRVVINECTTFPNRKAQVKSGAGKAAALDARTEPGVFGMAGRRVGTTGLLTTVGLGAEAVPRAREC